MSFQKLYTFRFYIPFFFVLDPTTQIVQNKNVEEPLLDQDLAVRIDKNKINRIRTEKYKRQKIKRPLGERIGSLASLNDDASDKDSTKRSFW